jgi:hypothetical protein
MRFMLSKANGCYRAVIAKKPTRKAFPTFGHAQKALQGDQNF